MQKGTLLSLIIILSISTAALAFNGDMGTGTQPLTDGSEDYPWLIEDYDDFVAFCGNTAYWASGVYTRLECNLDLSVAGTYSQAPIAGDTNTDSTFDGTAYAGNFDGDYKIINHLWISGIYYCGLFGYIGSGGTVTNLGLENVDITGTEYIGGLCGFNGNGSINNCYAAGSVTGNNHTGGLCGFNVYGSINNCYANGAVAGNNNTGGLCGENYLGGSISNCYVAGTVTGNFRIGGLCGYNYRGNITDSYWNIDTSGQTASHGGWGLNDEQMKQAASYYGWTNGYWTIDEGNDYPRLAWENSVGTTINTDYPAATYAGNGTDTSPYELANASDLLCLMRRTLDWDKYFVLTDNIDFGGIEFTHPVIAYGSEFSGAIDGNNHTISSFTINAPTQDYVGFIGILDSSASINNLGLTALDVTGDSYTGGLCGRNYYGGINDCYITGNITGDYCIGGLCGYNYHGNISSCYATGAITGNKYTGGLCGFNADGNISNCYATGDITGNDDAGGLCGYNSGSISNCYATGDITGNDDAGGLCGYNSGSISNCYATGDITGNDDVGGLCGYNSDSISNCYANGNIIGNYDVGGLCGCNSDSISNCYANGTVTGHGYYTGGLCGYNSSGSISSCYAAGLVTGYLDTGGFCGSQYGSSAKTLNCFWDIDATGQAVGYNLSSSEPGTIGNVQGLSTAQMQIESTFISSGWDFTESDNDPADWLMPTGNYPRLFWQSKLTYIGQGTISLPEEQTGIIELNVYSLINATINWTIAEHDLCDWITNANPNSGSSTGPEDITTVTIEIDTYGLGVGQYTYNLMLTGDDGSTTEMPIFLNVFNRVDLGELAVLSANWLATECYNSTSACYKADWYIDGVINELDLMQLSLSWLGEETIYDGPWSDYLEDFSDGTVPTENWTYNRTNDGKMAVVNERLRMDCLTSAYSLNEAILHIDLSDQTDVMLEFWQAESGDELHSLPTTFSGSYNGDGVAVSPDGVNWTTVINASALDVDTAGSIFTVDLDALGLEYTSDFQIKFQQYDNYAWDSDGREWDNIRIYKTE